MLAWLYLSAAIVLEVTATLSLRASEGLTRWGWLIPIAIGYLGAFALLAQVLKLGIPVGVAYGVWAASGVALTALLAWAIFKEPLTWMMLVGIVLIALGVAFVELGQSQKPN